MIGVFGRELALASGRRSVVTAEAGSNRCFIVVEGGSRHEPAGIVTAVARIGRRQMLARSTLQLADDGAGSDRFRAVMAADAGAARCLGMVKARRIPRYRRMTALAGIGAREVICRFAGGFRAIVAGKAVAGHVDVVELGARP